MRIVGAFVYIYDLQYRFGEYGMSKARSSSSNPALVVKLVADSGEIGWGETSVPGRAYGTGFHEGNVEALRILIDCVLGLDPREHLTVQNTLDAQIKSATGPKAAIDIACWDLAAKSAGVSVTSLLGGKMQQSCRAWDSIPLLAPDAILRHVEERMLKGVSVIQIKVGGDPLEDGKRVKTLFSVVDEKCLVIADANAGWNVQSALMAIQEMPASRLFIEQPCASLSSCAIVKAATPLPMIIDEGFQTIEDLIEIKHRVGAGGISIKPSKLGGLTRARLARDLAVELGMMVTIDDLWGGTITTAALVHLAASTPAESLLAVTPFADFTIPSISNSPRCGADGCITQPDGPGLGINVDATHLSPPLFSVGKDITRL